MKILLSVKPEYVCRILNKSKRFEFRHKLAKKKIDGIVLYSTYPDMKIVVEVEVLGTITASPTKLWEKTKGFAGISRQKYREYFRGRKVANAYSLGEVTIYDTKKDLSEFGIKNAPQSFVYLSEEKTND